MSDITLQSQQMAQQSQQFNAQRSDAAQQDMVSGLRQDVHFTQELAMQQESASLRNQMAQQEIQLNQGKLQMMQAIDQTDMGRVQVETAREQLKSLQFENKQREQALTTGPEAKSRDQFVKFATGMPKEYWLAKGMLPNFETGTFEQADQAAIEKAYSKSNTSDGRLQKQYTLRWLQEYQKQHRAGGIGAWDSPESESFFKQHMQGIGPDGVPSGASTAGNPANQASPSAPQAAQQPGEWKQNLPPIAAHSLRYLNESSDPKFDFFKKADDQTQQQIVGVMSVMADDLVRNSRTAISPEGAPLYVMKLFKDNPESAGMILRAANYSDDQIRNLWKLRGLDDARIARGMQFLDLETKQFLEQR